MSKPSARQPPDARLAVAEGQLRSVRQERHVRACAATAPGTSEPRASSDAIPISATSGASLSSAAARTRAVAHSSAPDQGVIGHQVGVVAAHGQRSPQGLGRLLGPHRQVADRVDGPGILEAQRLLDGVLVERIDDRLGGGAVEAQVGGVALLGGGGGTCLMLTTIFTGCGLLPASAGRAGHAGPLQELTRDDEALDLLRALVELRDLRVAHHPLDRVLGDVAVSAQDLDGVGGDPHGGVAGDQLGAAGPVRQVRCVGVHPRPRQHRSAAGPPRSALAMSASMNWIPSKSDHALAELLRARPRRRPRRRWHPARCPTACAAMLRRRRSRVAMAILKPSPSSPMRFAAGTRTSSKVSSAVGEPRIPILCSTRGAEKPGRVGLDDEGAHPLAAARVRIGQGEDGHARWRSRRG